MDVAKEQRMKFCNASALAIAAVFVVSCTPIDTSNDGPISLVDPFQYVEQQILDVTDESYENGNTSVAYALKRQMLEWDIAPHEENAHAYWIAFLNFNLARLEEHFGDSEQSLLLIDQALGRLNSFDESHVEAQALKAILVKSKIPLVPDETFELLMDMQDVLDNAMNLDSENFRVQLGAVMDAVIEVPGFGGEIDADAVLESALSMNPHHSENIGSIFDHPPTWGRAEVLALKAVHLRNSGNKDGAAETIESALEEFPNHFMLRILETEELQ